MRTPLGFRASFDLKLVKIDQVGRSRPIKRYQLIDSDGDPYTIFSNSQVLIELFSQDLPLYHICGTVKSLVFRDGMCITVLNKVTPII